MFDRYAEQVRILMRMLPIVAGETVFALKGGTAINFFIRNMPRLSVDIDLTYLLPEDFNEALSKMDSALGRIETAAKRAAPELKIQRIAGGGNLRTRLMVSGDNASIKIETSPVLRGVVEAPVIMQTSDAVQEAYGFAEMSVLAFNDLYAGKIHAALDRQHPRDLFDILQLYENEGLSEPLFNVFLIYAASSSRPIHELLNPNFKNLDEPYAKEFLGMTREEVSIKSLEEARARLVEDIQSRLHDDTAKFLLSLHDAEPDFDLIGIPTAETFPAIGWKLQNLQKLKTDNPGKHGEQRKALEALFNI